MPSARVTMLRCGCDRASSGDERALAHPLLDEAVVLGELLQLAVPEQVDARVADVDPRERARVAVHRRDRRRASCPCRARSGSPLARSNTASFASLRRVDERVGGRLGERSRRATRARSDSRPRRLGGHPCRRRPRTRGRRRDSSPRSWCAPGRRRWPIPTGHAPPLPHLEHGVADLQAITLLHHHRPGDLVAVEVRAVGGAEILHASAAVAGEHAGVELRDVGVVDRDLTAGGAADRDLVTERIATARRGLRARPPRARWRHLVTTASRWRRSRGHRRGAARPRRRSPAPAPAGCGVATSAHTARTTRKRNR